MGRIDLRLRAVVSSCPDLHEPPVIPLQSCWNPSPRSAMSLTGIANASVTPYRLQRLPGLCASDRSDEGDRSRGQVASVALASPIPEANSAAVRTRQGVHCDRNDERRLKWSRVSIREIDVLVVVVVVGVLDAVGAELVV